MMSQHLLRRFKMEAAAAKTRSQGRHLRCARSPLDALLPCQYAARQKLMSRGDRCIRMRDDRVSGRRRKKGLVRNPIRMRPRTSMMHTCDGPGVHSITTRSWHLITRNSQCPSSVGCEIEGKLTAYHPVIRRHERASICFTEWCKLTFLWVDTPVSEVSRQLFDR